MKRLVCAALLVSACATTTTTKTAPSAAPSSFSSSFSWDLTLLAGGDVDVGAVATRVCFVGPPPQHIAPENLAALPWLMDVPRLTDRQGRDGGPALDVDDKGIVTGGLADDACVAFVVDVEAAARAIDDKDVAAVVGRAVVGSPDAWLWRPRPWTVSGGAAARLVVRAEASGLGVAVPFARDGDDDDDDDDKAARYLVPPSTFALQCFSALGTFAPRLLEHRGARLQVVRVGPAAGGLDDDAIDEWLRVAVDDVAVPLGRFPVDAALVLLVPSFGRRPLLAGFLGRGGGTSALFYVGRGPFDFVDDPEILDEDGRWVFTHELAHTLLPPVSRGDGWLNEGLTTWHQEVLPAAAGRRPRSAADAQLAVGFQTGAVRATQDRLDVEQSCKQMDTRGSYQHCYWSGARLTALLADEVGDAGVFALVRALHGLAAQDALPAPALTLLQAAASSSDPQAAQAAAALLRLWEEHKRAPFPTPSQSQGIRPAADPS